MILFFLIISLLCDLYRKFIDTHDFIKINVHSLYDSALIKYYYKKQIDVEVRNSFIGRCYKLWKHPVVSLEQYTYAGFEEH